MNDPHVNSLTYVLITEASLSFDNPPPIEMEFPSFNICLKDGILTVTMIEHFSSQDSARQCVEPMLEAWTLDVGLRAGRDEFSFRFKNATLVDRNPLPTSPGHILQACAGEITLTGMLTSCTVTRKYYPSPPNGLLVSADVRTMWNRYLNYVAQKEPLLSMAYFCLTVIENSTGEKKNQREHAGKLYNISPDLLGKLGQLVSETGDETQARKLGLKSRRAPLSGAEETWIRDAIRLIIRRKAEYDSSPGSVLPFLDLGQLPIV
jgi:hypothetical protein